MNLSIRARLTLWYGSAVVAIVAIGITATFVVQSRLALSRLDDDLVRSMATLEGVLRTEIGEGLSVEDAALEASQEVVVPGRSLILRTQSGRILHVWGLPVAPDVSAREPVVGALTFSSADSELRVLTRALSAGPHVFVGSVLAPLSDLRSQHSEFLRAMVIGGAFALLAAVAGGWLIARQTLRPLTAMATEAALVDEHDPKGRLTVPPVNDELGQLADAFNELLARLSRAIDQQRQFMADASHELRTPVSIVRTTSDVLLAKDERTPEEYRESFEVVSAEAERLSRLVDSMFLLSRAEAGGVPLHREYVHLDELVSETARGFRVLARQRGVSVETTGAQEVSLVGDDGLLRRLIANLLDNAIRHARPEGLVTLRVASTDSQATLKVTDDGDGVPADCRERIFERFARHNPSEGAGLGLPIARWIAVAHQGTLILESGEPGATTFTVVLPRRDVIVGSSAL